jgi:uncharacterized protein (DUF302 family)
MYYLSELVSMSFEDAVAATKDALKRHNFDVLAEIDMREAFRKHLAVDFRPYLILGACNPQLAHRAIRTDEEIGSVVVSNIVVQQHDDGRVEISAADPVAAMGPINHVELMWVTRDIRSALRCVVDEVGDRPESQRASPEPEEAGRRQLAHAA